MIINNVVAQVNNLMINKGFGKPQYLTEVLLNCSIMTASTLFLKES